MKTLINHTTPSIVDEVSDCIKFPITLINAKIKCHVDRFNIERLLEATGDLPEAKCRSLIGARVGGLVIAGNASNSN